MSNVPNSSLPVWTDGTTVDQAALNQLQSVLQVAVNDNYEQIISLKGATESILVATGSADPTLGSTGQLFYRTDTAQMRIYNGTSWVDALSVVATANALVLNGVTYVAAISASSDTVVVRDTSGGISAVNGMFSGSLSTEKNILDDGTGAATLVSLAVQSLTVNGQAVTGSNNTFSNGLNVTGAISSTSADIINGRKMPTPIRYWAGL